MTDESDSYTPSTDSHSQPPHQPAMTPPAPLQSTLPDNGKRKADETKNEADELAREFRMAEKWVIGTNITLAIIGIVALCIYHGQLEVMRGQLGEIIKQYPEFQKSANANVKVANQTEMAVKDAADNFRIGQRAWVGVGAFVITPKPTGTPDNLIPYKMASKNTGLTPALDFYIEHGVMIKDRPYLIESDFSEANTLRLKDIDKRFDPKRHSHNPVLPNVAPDTSQTYYTPIPPANKHLFIAGTAYYKDIFGHPHKTLFCGHLVGNALPLCNIHNTMD